MDYLKLNDGLDETPEVIKSPKTKKHRTHLPSRSGPSSTRQRAQRTVTSPPAQVLAASPVKPKSAETTSNNNPATISGVQDFGGHNIPNTPY